MTRRKNPRNPGDTVSCAADGCSCSFTLKRQSMHQLYCSKRCRDMASRMAEAERDPLSRNAKRLQMEAEHIGGTVQGGAMVSGTAILGKREVFDVWNPPADDARFW